MGFLFMKLVKPLLLPPTLLIVGLLVLLMFVWKGKKKCALGLLASLIFFSYVFSIGPIAGLLVGSLENDYALDPTLPDASGVAAIVVLAGGASEREDGHVELIGASTRRLLRAVEIYRAYDGALPILYSGGSGDPFQPVSHEAPEACRIARDLGVREQDCIAEDQSRNTAESGRAVRSFLAERGAESEALSIILVTSAFHLPRSVKVFETQGFSVTPAPADIRALSERLTPLSFFPSVDYLNLSVLGIHERMGIFGYWLAGWIR